MRKLILPIGRANCRRMRPSVCFSTMPKEEAQRAEERGLAAALTHYFELRAQWIERDQRELFRLGWRYLAVRFCRSDGLPAVKPAPPRLIGEGPTTKIIQEGLVILGCGGQLETPRNISLRLVAVEAACRAFIAGSRRQMSKSVRHEVDFATRARSYNCTCEVHRSRAI